MRTEFQIKNKKELDCMLNDIEGAAAKLIGGKGERRTVNLAVVVCEAICERLEVGLHKSDLNDLKKCKTGLIKEIKNYEFIF